MTPHVTLIHVELRALDRWAVGVIPDADATVKSPTAINPCTGKPHIPGSSLAGSLKRHLRNATTWMANDPSAWEEATGDIDRSRSRLAVLGATVRDGTVQSRGSTAVNPTRRAALENTLREEQWVEPGVIDVLLCHDGERDAELVAELLSWRPVIGRGASSGMGRALPIEVRTLTLDLTKAEHLRWWLSTRHTWYAAPATTPCPDGTCAVEPQRASGEVGQEAEPTWDAGVTVLQVRWRVVDPIHIGTHEGNRADGIDAPSVNTDDLLGKKQATIARTMRLKGEVLIPGSSWKGIYRHRTDHIATVLGMTEVERQRLGDVLFGSLARAGLLRFADTVAAATVVTRTHVSIDRFTGGALDGGLFTVEAIAPHTELDHRISANRDVPPEVVALLTHVTRDLHDGLIGVGGHTTRGYGSVVASTEEAVGMLTAGATRLSREGLIAAVETLETGGGEQ